MSALLHNTNKGKHQEMQINAHNLTEHCETLACQNCPTQNVITQKYEPSDVNIHKINTGFLDKHPLRYYNLDNMIAYQLMYKVKRN